MSRTQTTMPAAEAADRSVADSSAVAAELGADLEKGLTAQTAARRLVEGGANELRAAPRMAVWRRVLAQFQDPLVYLSPRRPRRRTRSPRSRR